MLDAGAPSGRPLPWFQIFKYSVFGLLTLNAGQFFLQDYVATRHLFSGDLQWSQIIEGYAATIDTVAWLILLLMFELETSLLPDGRLHNSWVKWSVNTLKAIAYGWQQEAIAREAKEIAALGKELYDRIGVVAGHFAKLGKSLGQSVEHYNKAVSSVETRLLSTAKKFQALDSASAAELPEVKGIETIPALPKPKE